jgi:uncharacterized membrane protein YsdA (DUF1294 family)
MKFVYLILCYLVLINLVTFAAMGIDKRRARKRARRTPEALLMLLAILGGSPGGILGMGLFRHKTKHRKFYIGMPLIFLLEFAGVLAYFWIRRG